MRQSRLGEVPNRVPPGHSADLQETRSGGAHRAAGAVGVSRRSRDTRDRFTSGPQLRARGERSPTPSEGDRAQVRSNRIGPLSGSGTGPSRSHDPSPPRFWVSRGASAQEKKTSEETPGPAAPSSGPAPEGTPASSPRFLRGTSRSTRGRGSQPRSRASDTPPHLGQASAALTPGRSRGGPRENRVRDPCCALQRGRRHRGQSAARLHEGHGCPRGGSRAEARAPMRTRSHATWVQPRGCGTYARSSLPGRPSFLCPCAVGLWGGGRG